jgi:hypothetical protein
MSFREVECFLANGKDGLLCTCPATPGDARYGAAPLDGLCLKTPMQKCIGGIGLRYSFGFTALLDDAWFRIHAASIDYRNRIDLNQQAR